MAYYYPTPHSKIELHYWLENKSHSMDAYVQNRCEDDFLDLLSEVSKIFKVKVIVETEPLTEGGLRRYYNIISKEEYRKAVITTAVIANVITAIITTPLTASISKVCEEVIEKVFEDEKTKELEDEKLKLEIEKLKQEIKLNRAKIDNNKNIAKKHSNFYNNLTNYPKVEKISFRVKNEVSMPMSNELTVEKSDFKNLKDNFKYNEVNRFNSEANTFTNEIVLIKEEIQNVNLEIIAPDFSANSNNWKGLYNGNLITFEIIETEFKNLVQSGDIQFRKGSTINCQLLIKRINTRKIVYEAYKINSFNLN
jgi:hypothetical protein